MIDKKERELFPYLLSTNVCLFNMRSDAYVFDNQWHYNLNLYFWPSCVTYWVSIVSIFQNIDRVMMALHCTY